MTNVFVTVNSANTTLIFIHAKNAYIPLRQLWTDLTNIQSPRIYILGDFNVVLCAHERTSDTPINNLESEEFQAFIATMYLFDVDSNGNQFTWSIRCSPTGVTASRLDRVLAHKNFLVLWLNFNLLVLPKHCSIGSPSHPSHHYD